MFRSFTSSVHEVILMLENPDTQKNKPRIGNMPLCLICTKISNLQVFPVLFNLILFVAFNL